MIWATDLAMESIQFEPKTDLIWQGNPTVCGHCGKPIAEGDYCGASGSSSFFSDTRHLANLNGLSCAACLVLKSQPGTFAFMDKVITRNGLQFIKPDAGKRWLFLNPPKEPFVANLSSAKMQHLVFRTPVSLSPDRFNLRFGRQLFTIRPAILKNALAINEKLQRSSERGHEPLFARNDRDLRDSLHGRLSFAARKNLNNDDIDFILRMTPGETWAMGYLLTRAAGEEDEPTTPEFVDTGKFMGKLYKLFG